MFVYSPSKYIDYFVLLFLHRRQSLSSCPDQRANPMIKYKHPSDMGINQLISGFCDEEVIKRAAMEEIQRRVSRYQLEIDHGIELKNTMDHVRKILSRTPYSI